MKRLILALLTGAAFAASSPAYAAVKTIVLVHGAFADGSGWKPVADILQSHGYSVLVVQEPETSFAADVAATRRARGIVYSQGWCRVLPLVVARQSRRFLRTAGGFAVFRSEKSLHQNQFLNV